MAPERIMPSSPMENPGHGETPGDDEIREIARDREYLRALFTKAAAAIATVDNDGRIVEINPAFIELFGYKPEEAVGRDLNELVVPNEQLESARGLDRDLRSDESVCAEVWRRRRDGSLVFVKASAAYARGVETGTSFVIYDDCTALKEIETELRATREQYRLLIESASDLIWRMDRQLRWTFLNPAAREVYGRDPESLIGTALLEVAAPGYREYDREMWETLLKGEEITDYETVHLDAAGQRRNLSFSARPVSDAAGAIIGASGIARDVTARAEARRAIEEARAAAERAAGARSSFLANMSHEIRTPMNGVLGMTELLLETDLTEEQHQSLQLIRDSADALLRIINDILDFSKIESGRFALEETTFDLHAHLDSCVRPFAVQAHERGLELLYEIGEGIPHRVNGDPGRLRQVLTNLIGNALKFTPEGEVFIQVFTPPIDPTDDGAVPVTFSVRDTGIGIPVGMLEAIFEEFTQADASTTRRFGGTGLGLSISRRIIALMGGELTAESEEGAGSVFSFTVPFTVLPGEAAEGPVERRRIRLEGRHVLVVDDNETNLRITRGMLEAVGWKVDTVDSAEGGLTLMTAAVERGRAYELAIIDAYMPGQDGFRMVETIRSRPDLAGTRLMILTSGGQRGDGQRCLDLGVTAYLTKPVSKSDLLEMVVVIMTGIEDQEPPAGLITRHTIEETRVRRRILLAEDNPVNQKVAVSMLRRRGHDVDVVSNGVEALEALERETYDLVLMDVQMPEMDGLEAVRRIRADARFADLPVIALTAHAMSGDAEEFIAQGMSGYIAKPFRPHELFSTVEEWATDAFDPRDKDAVDDR